MLLLFLLSAFPFPTFFCGAFFEGACKSKALGICPYNNITPRPIMKEDSMDLDPSAWAIIILAATAVGGGLLFWSTKPKPKKKP